MTPRLEFWFDFSCPYAYLASTQVEALAHRAGAALTFCPMLLGGVFRAVNTPQILAHSWSEARNRHNLADMFRQAARLEVPLHMPSGHPMRTVEALRLLLAAGVSIPLIHRIYRAYWVEGVDISDLEVLRALADSVGLDGAALVGRLEDPGVKEALRTRTDRAVTLGIFGAPSMRVNEDLMFWGLDRLHFVEKALTGWRPLEQAWAGRPLAVGAGSGTAGAEAEAGPNGGEASGRSSSDASRPTLDFYFDFSSPFAYLASTQIEGVAARTGAALRWRPMLLGAVFKALGTPNVPLHAMPAPRRRMYELDMFRFAEHLEVPFRFPSRFPMNTVQALRCCLELARPAAGSEGIDPTAARAVGFIHRAFRAYWAEDRDLADPAVLASLLDAVGTDPQSVLEAIQGPGAREGLREATQAAIDAGVFGTPTCVVDQRFLFWGQDRLELVEATLRGWEPPA